MTSLGKKPTAGETAASALINVDRDNNRKVDDAIVDGSTSQISDKSRYHDNKSAVEVAKIGTNKNEDINKIIGFQDVNQTKIVQLHNSQWLLYNGLVAATHKVAQFYQIMPHVNHGVRREDTMANIINSLLGNPADLKSKEVPLSVYNSDRMIQRLYNKVSLRTQTLSIRKDHE